MFHKLALGVLGIAAALAGSPPSSSDPRPSPNQIELCKIDPAHCNNEQQQSQGGDPGYGVQDAGGSVSFQALESAAVRLQQRVDALEARDARNGGRQ